MTIATWLDKNVSLNFSNSNNIQTHQHREVDGKNIFKKFGITGLASSIQIVSEEEEKTYHIN